MRNSSRDEQCRKHFLRLTVKADTINSSSCISTERYIPCVSESTKIWMIALLPFLPYIYGGDSRYFLERPRMPHRLKLWRENFHSINVYVVGGPIQELPERKEIFLCYARIFPSLFNCVVVPSHFRSPQFSLR